MSSPIILFDNALTLSSGREDSENMPDLESYDFIIVAFSGGKDSWASILRLKELGIDMSRCELWHHRVDGDGPRFFDWGCTDSYTQASADALGLPIYYSWRMGGIKGELLRHNALTRPVEFETPEGLLTAGGIRGKLNTRRRWPALSADLRSRWCSSCVKIDVSSVALTNQERFRGKRVLFVTGERAEESTNRAHYARFEPHKNDLRDGRKYQRHIDHWRPVHQWTEQDVWAIMQRHGINAHPAYKLGWSRCSCMYCIFNGHNHWASLSIIDPEGMAEIERLEKEFDFTMHPKLSIMQRVAMGTPFEMKPEDVLAAMSPTWDQPIFLAPEKWELPAGAYRKGVCGPN